MNQLLFDLRNQNQSVLSVEKAINVLKSLKQIEYSNIDAEYLKFTGYYLPEYENMVRNEKFYAIENKDIYLKISGDIRIRDFLPKDQYLNHSIRRSKNQLYWLVDTCLIYKIIELQQLLLQNNYNYRAIKLISAYRYPSYNKRVGGVRNSRHLIGEAADILIMDVNMDKKYTEKDKALVYQLLDQKVIGQKGGIGRYPDRRTIHIDVRGKKARWDY